MSATVTRDGAGKYSLATGEGAAHRLITPEVLEEGLAEMRRLAEDETVLALMPRMARCDLANGRQLWLHEPYHHAPEAIGRAAGREPPDRHAACGRSRCLT